MRNIKSQYTLPELCADLGLSPAWLRKVVQFLGSRQGLSSQRGKKTYFDLWQVEFFRRIASLRRFGIGLEDIKNIYNKEKEIIDFVAKNLRADNPEYFIPIYLTADLLTPGREIGYDRKKYNSEKTIAKKLDELCKEYAYIINTVALQTAHNYKILGREANLIEDIAKSYKVEG